MRAGTLAATAASAALVAAGLVTGASAAAATDGATRQDAFAAARAATAGYHDITQAVGFAELEDAAGIACIDNPAGGMGVHYVDGARIDGVLDPAKPEALVYEPQPDGSLQLGVLEYVIFASDWQGSGPPQMYGQSFEYMPGPGEVGANRFGLPAFWELHAWVWKTNPRGMFDDWNPKVTCP